MRIDHCEFPDDLLYDIDRGTWGKAEGDTLRLGVTSILSWSFGIFSAVTQKAVGTEVAAGQVIGSVEGSRHFDVIRTPVSGIISAVNTALAGQPELLNKDPYGNGWFAELRVKNRSELEALGRLPEAKVHLERTLTERHVRCFKAFPDHEMFDIGVECSAVLVKLNELLANSREGIVVHVVSDDSSAEIEMERWSDQTGNAVLDTRKEGGLYHFIVQKKRTD